VGAIIPEIFVVGHLEGIWTLPTFEGVSVKDPTLEEGCGPSWGASVK